MYPITNGFELVKFSMHPPDRYVSSETDAFNNAHGLGLSEMVNNKGKVHILTI